MSRPDRSGFLRPGGPARYAAAVVVLLLGLGTFGLGVRSAVLQVVAASSESQIAAAATGDEVAASGSPSQVVVPAPEPPEPSPPAPTGSTAADVTIRVAATEETRCWAEGCVLREAIANANCSSAEATLTIKNANGFVTGPNLTQMVGAFAAGVPRVVEIDGVQPVADKEIDAGDEERLSVEVECRDLAGLS